MEMSHFGQWRVRRPFGCHRLGLFDLQDFRKAMREVGFDRIRMYLDWKFARERKQNEFRDNIFVGHKHS